MLPNMSEIICRSITDSIPIWINTFAPILTPIFSYAFLVFAFKFLQGSIVKTSSKMLGDSNREIRNKIKRNNNIIDLVTNLFKFKG